MNYHTADMGKAGTIVKKVYWLGAIGWRSHRSLTVAVP